MAMLPDLIQAQIGKETTWGTAVTETAKLMGIDELVIRPINEAEQFPDRRASLAPAYLSALTKIGMEGQMGGVLLYEDLPYWLDNLCGEATPTGSDPYTYTYAAPLTAVPSSPRILTLTGGDSSDIYTAAGVLLNGLTISGESNKPLRWSAPLIGEDVATGALESLSDRSVNVVMADHVALYIDAWGGTIGSTAITSNFFKFTLNINPNRAVVYGMGSKTPGEWREARWTGDLAMTLEFDATTQAFFDAIIGGSSVFQKQVRIKASSGASLDVQLDFAGTALTAPEIFTDENGIVTLEFNLHGEYNSTLTQWFEAQVINGVASLA